MSLSPFIAECTRHGIWDENKKKERRQFFYDFNDPQRMFRRSGCVFCLGDVEAQ